MKNSSVLWIVESVVLLICSCSMHEMPKAHTTGLGVYPGRPTESGAPTLVDGGKTERNLAIGRAAKHSSSCDFDRTAQLVTDGIRQYKDSMFCSVWTSEGNAEEWISVDLGALSRINRMVFHWTNAPVSGSILRSKDGIQWKEIVQVGESESFVEVKLPKTKARFVKAVLDKTADGAPFGLEEWEV